MIEQTIVVGVDGSPASDAALRWAADTATIRGGSLRLVHGFVWPAYAAAYGMPPASWGTDPLHGEAESLIKRVAARAHELAPGVPVHGIVLQGSPAAVLTEAAKQASMLVVGSRGAGGFSGLLLGSVSTQCARHSPGCVVVVPEDFAPSETPRIVVGADGSAGAEPALRFAFDEAVARGATLSVVRAWQPPRLADPAEVEGTELQLLRESVAPWRERYPAVIVEPQLVADHPARALAAAAEGARLLAVGARGQGGFGGLRLGSVSLQVLHHARVPVAVVHPHHHE